MSVFIAAGCVILVLPGGLLIYYGSICVGRKIVFEIGVILVLSGGFLLARFLGEFLWPDSSFGVLLNMLSSEDLADFCLDFVALLDGFNQQEVASLHPHTFPEFVGHGDCKNCLNYTLTILYYHFDTHPGSSPRWWPLPPRGDCFRGY